MDARSTTSTVTFAHAFSIAGLDTVWPAGTYTVVTDEEQLDLSFPVYRRIRTNLILKSGGVTQSLTIEPDALADLLQNDRPAR